MTPLAVTMVGSWPRPRELLRAQKLKRAGKLSQEEFDAQADRAVLDLLRLQEEVGVDIVTDGEQRRDNFYSFVAEKLEGVRLMSLAEMLDIVEDKEGFRRILDTLDVPAFSIHNPTCVGKIRMQSLVRIGEDGLWAEDRWHPLYYAIRVEQVALPLYPQWGTEPNGFYIPPRHSPRGYARQMFGPGVDNAIEKYLVPSRELLAVLQLWRASQQIIFRYDVIPGPKVFETQIHGKRFEMYNDTVLGFNKSGKEVARIQVEEPIYVRPAERVNWL